MKFEKKHFVYLLIGLLCSFMIYGIHSYTNVIEGLELMALDGMFKIRNDPPRKIEGVVQKNERLKI